MPCPTYHILRVRDLWQRDLHSGSSDIAVKGKPGEREPNPNYWKWCKWMQILHEPWTINPWTGQKPLWGTHSAALKEWEDAERLTRDTGKTPTVECSLDADAVHTIYQTTWATFTTTVRGRTIQARIDRARADRMAIRDTLLDDNDFREGNWGNKTINCIGCDTTATVDLHHHVVTNQYDIEMYDS